MSTRDDWDSYYDDGPSHYRTVRTRTRDRDDPDIIREEIYTERGKGVGPRGAELVYRGRDESVEDIPRDFPPPGRDRVAGRRARSVASRRYDDDYDGYTDRGRRDRDRRSRRGDRDYDSEYSRSPPPRQKSGVGEVLEGLGLGGVAGAFLGDKNKGRSRPGSPAGRSVRSRSQARSQAGSRDGDDRRRTERKWAQAAQAALVAGAIEAFRSRKEPGPWTGEKGKRIATAALASGGIDGLLDRNPEKKSKLHLAEAVVGGLVANRLANGPRSKSRGRQDRSISPDGPYRSRSRSFDSRYRGRSMSRPRSVSSRGRSPRGGNGNGGNGGAVKGLVAGGALAAAGTALYDRWRSKSRKRRSPSSSSADSYVPSRNRRRDRRRSPPSDTASTRPDGGQRDRGLDRGGSRGGSQTGPQGNRTAAAGEGSKNGEGNKSDTSSTTDLENRRKKMRTKQFLTAGLASIATIHAAHGVYSSMEAHEKRHRLVAEGEMSPEEARKKQTKAWIQDAAAVGIAALGIKGAFSEWKEMRELSHETQEMENRKRERRKKQILRQKQQENERQERMMSILERNPQLAMGYQLNQMSNAGTGPEFGVPGRNQQRSIPAAADQSGNPYAPR